MIKFVENFEPPGQLETPVLYMVFNRLDIVEKAFGQIRKAKPKKLYIAQDGPRPHVPDEKDKILKVREYILSNIDWDCEVKTLFREENLGINKAIPGAVDWFFENEEQGIILEEDIYMSLSGFWFLEKMLNKFKDDKDVWFVFAYNTVDIPYDYVKADSFGAWGYATWKDKWMQIDFSHREDLSFLDEYFENKRIAKFNKAFFNHGKYLYDIKIWLEMVFNKAYSIVPKTPLTVHLDWFNGTSLISDAFNENLFKYHPTVETLKDIDISFLEDYENLNPIRLYERAEILSETHNIFAAIHSKKAENNIKNMLSKYNKIAIYGAGMLGYLLYATYDDLLNDKVCCFLDDNPQCNELFGKPVLKPENMPQDIELIVISPQSKAAYQNMKKKVSSKDVVWIEDLVF